MVIRRAITTPQVRENTSLGDRTLYSTTSGNDNTAVGALALRLNTTGSYNTAMGQQALTSNTTAGNSTAVGYQAAYSQTTASGGNNTAFGYRALYTNSTGYQNTAIGTQSLELCTGVYNTAVGNNAGGAMLSGDKNTIIGPFDGNQYGLDIRHSDNNIVLSDGDGNPRMLIDQYGRYRTGYTYSSNAGTNFVAACANNTWHTIDTINFNAQPYNLDKIKVSVRFRWQNSNGTYGYYVDAAGEFNPSGSNLTVAGTYNHIGGTDVTGATGVDSIPVRWGTHVNSTTLVVKMRLFNDGSAKRLQIYTNGGPASGTSVTLAVLVEGVM